MPDLQGMLKSKFKLHYGNDVLKAGNHARAIALGNFDGVHCGHKKIISTLREEAAKNGLTPAIMTFEPHPVKLFNPDRHNYRLTMLEEKLELLKQFGIEEIFVIDFDIEYAGISAEDFIRHIIEDINARILMTGDDFSFGKNRSGNAETLRQFSQKFNFTYKMIKAINNDDGVRYSSTTIRNYLEQGNIREANKMMGHRYSITGKVAEGNKKGRTIGFPTLNLDFDQDKLIPKFGVYKSSTLIDGKEYNSITNIGIRPTIGGQKTLCETHILGFDKEIYGVEVKVSLEDFIREEKKFGSLQELQEQIKQDILQLN